MFAVQTSVTFLPGLLLEISNVSGREFTGMRTMKCMPIAFDANSEDCVGNVWDVFIQGRRDSPVPHSEVHEGELMLRTSVNEGLYLVFAQVRIVGGWVGPT